MIKARSNNPFRGLRIRKDKAVINYSKTNPGIIQYKTIEIETLAFLIAMLEKMVWQPKKDNLRLNLALKIMKKVSKVGRVKDY